MSRSRPVPAMIRACEGAWLSGAAGRTHSRVKNEIHAVLMRRLEAAPESADCWEPVASDAGHSGCTARMFPARAAPGSNGSSDSGVVKAGEEEEERAVTARDPMVTTRTEAIKIGKMLAGFVRPPA